ncbi:MAG TPA: Ig-like domain-containing protein, partial [Xanthomonadales bacterium]|nr:Ig-like domain-containing protein [Xanthomonadales bacterium]
GLTYAPDADFCSATADTFTYTLNGGSTATVSVTVTCVDDAPVAVDDVANVAQDSAATTIPVLDNDTDVDGGPKSIASATQPANGTVVVAGDGSDLTYAPNAGYCAATPDTFTYTLNGGSTGNVAVLVSCASDAPPTAVADSATVTEDSGANAIDVLANDTDTDGGPKSIAGVTQPGNGTVVVTGGGTGLTYAPDADFCSATADTFTYTLNGGSTTTVSVTVTCVDDAPVAVADSATVAQDSAATAIPVLGNDTDLDGGTKSIDSVTQPANGSVAITGGGTGLAYTPNAGFCSATPDTFSYTLNGGSTAAVSVTVTCTDPGEQVDPIFSNGFE